MKTGIIITCYNESQNFDKQLFVKFINSLNPYHLCFVNNGSSDTTIKILKELQTINPKKVTVIDLKKRSSQAFAIRAGARYLYSHENIMYIGFVDLEIIYRHGNLQHFLETLKTSNDLDLVFGSRIKNATDIIKDNELTAVITKIDPNNL